MTPTKAILPGLQLHLTLVPMTGTAIVFVRMQISLGSTFKEPGYFATSTAFGKSTPITVKATVRGRTCQASCSSLHHNIASTNATTVKMHEALNACYMHSALGNIAGMFSLAVEADELKCVSSL